MDDFLTRNKEHKQDIDTEKKIEFRFFKEKRSTRTYIYNLDIFITDPNKLKTFLKKLKKSLGTSCTKKNTDFGLAYGFNGDLKSRIKHEIIKNNIATENDFLKTI